MSNTQAPAVSFNLGFAQTIITPPPGSSAACAAYLSPFPDGYSLPSRWRSIISRRASADTGMRITDAFLVMFQKVWGKALR